VHHPRVVPLARHPGGFRLCAALLVILAASPFTFPFGTCDLIAPQHDAGASAGSAKAKLLDDAAVSGSHASSWRLAMEPGPAFAWRPGLAAPGPRAPRQLVLRL